MDTGGNSDNTTSLPSSWPIMKANRSICQARILELLENKNSKLSSLDISVNNIGPQGAKHIAEAIQTRKSCIHLLTSMIYMKGEMLLPCAPANKVLQTLNIVDNNIGDQGAAAFADALKVNTTVQTLNIGYNNLGDKGAALIAEAIKFNKTLLGLNIANNGLRTINPTLEALIGVELKDCFKELPAEVLQQGNKGILQYLRSVQSSGTRRSYQGKLVILGDMGVGKTSLMHTLQGKTYQGTSTVGVDIQEWAVTRPDPAVKEPLALSTWDFAGQEMYYSAHQLFLSRHSLFMLAWDPSTTE
eukprot:g78556.t1